MAATDLGNGMLTAVIVCLLLHLGVVPGLAEQASDPRELISFDPPAGWTPVSPGKLRETIRALNNPGLKLIGADPGGAVLFFAKITGAGDIIPHLQVRIHDIRGLGLSETDLLEMEKDLEKRYSERMGSRFKLLTLRRTELGGLRAARITGIYRWRTVNIKVLQCLLPGTDHLYEITYTAKEREFSRHLNEVEESLATVQIADPPLILDWLWNGINTLILLLLMGIILWLFLLMVGNRPGWQKSAASGERGTAVGSFLRKK